MSSLLVFLLQGLNTLKTKFDLTGQSDFAFLKPNKVAKVAGQKLRRSKKVIQKSEKSSSFLTENGDRQRQKDFGGEDRGQRQEGGRREDRRGEEGSDPPDRRRCSRTLQTSREISHQQGEQVRFDTFNFNFNLPLL